jgi:5-methylcytosine-specific restriction protein A
MAQHPFYCRKAWLTLREDQLREEPLCRMCLQDKRLVPATIVDHVVPHRGDPNLFFLGELQSLCELHHKSHKRRLELQGYSTQVGADGYPIDPQHPFNRGTADPCK